MSEKFSFKVFSSHCNYPCSFMLCFRGGSFLILTGMHPVS
jgi:hypothetical protein